MTSMPAAGRRSEMSKEEVLALPIKKYSGPVEVVNSEARMKGALRLLNREKLLGFDIECRPAFQKGESHPPAVVQLAGERRVFIFQLKFLPSLVPLAELFSRPDLVKAGVGIDDDIRKLREIMDFSPAGFIELGKMATKAGYTANGLRSLAGNLLGFRVSKGAARLSNWERQELTPAQIAYAATDAWVCLRIYLALQERL